MEDSVIINGVRYVPDPKHADGVRFYFMHNNHTFTRLHGITLDEVLAHADAVEAGKHGSYGMLCSATLLHGNKDVRRVGPAAHARGSNDPKDRWNAGKVEWRKAMEADADVMRLMPSNVKVTGSPALSASPCGLPGSAALDILDCLQDRPVAEGVAVPEKSVRLVLADCNWTCARANTCHEYECDGESHFVPNA